MNEFPCKIIAISMDSYEVIQDWLKKTPGLEEFDVPLMSDKKNDIAGQFGCLFGEQMDGEDHPGPGYCANAVFIVDRNDRVRYHEVLDARLMLDLEEIARVVSALKATDSGDWLAMPTWKVNSDSVINSKENVKEWYSTKPKTVKKNDGAKAAAQDSSKSGWSGWTWSGWFNDSKKVADSSSSSTSESTDSEKGSESESAVLDATWKYNSGALILTPNDQQSASKISQLQLYEV